MSGQGQAMAPETQHMDADAFGESPGTTLRWLGMAGLMINAWGTMDPLLGGFDTGGGDDQLVVWGSSVYPEAGRRARCPS